MQMLKEVVHATEPQFEYERDENGQIVKHPLRRSKDKQINTQDMGMKDNTIDPTDI